MTKSKKIRVFNITATLRGMEVNSEIEISIDDSKPLTIRKAAKRLNPMKFVVSEAGRTKTTYVKRTS